MCPTAMAIRACTNMRRTASCSSPGAGLAPIRASSTSRTTSPAMPMAGCMWPTARTIACRCSTATASTRRSGTTCTVRAACSPQPETQKVTTETANKPVALTELAAELDYASVLPQYTPLLLELDRLITAEQKRFDMVPAQIAFERGCLALVLQDAPSDLLEC